MTDTWSLRTMVLTHMRLDLTLPLVEVASHPVGVVRALAPANHRVVGWLGYPGPGPGASTAQLGYVVFGTPDTGWTRVRVGHAGAVQLRVSWSAMTGEQRLGALSSGLTSAVNRPTLVDLLMAEFEEPDEYGSDTDFAKGIFRLLSPVEQRSVRTLCGLGGFSCDFDQWTMDDTLFEAAQTA
jgi:hypothetical protein